MSTRLIKTLLSESYTLEGELVDLVKECLTKLFPEDSEYLIYQFEQDIDSGKEYNGCIQSLFYYQKLADRNKKSREERKANELASQ